MRFLHEPFGSLIALALALFLLGCSDRPPRLPEGDGWAEGDHAQAEREPLAPAPRAVAIPPERRLRWAHADLAAGLEAVPGRERSEHVDGAFERTVRINGKAHDYRASGAALSEGALILEDLHQPGSEAITVTFAMAKLAAGRSPATRDWSFAVLDGEMRETASGDLSLCARCHLESPHDGWFGPPAMK